MTDSNKNENKYHPEVEDTGWDPDMDPGKRRALVLKRCATNEEAHKAMWRYFHKTKNKKEREEAAKDAVHFLKAHQARRMHYPTSSHMQRISRPMPRLR